MEVSRPNQKPTSAKELKNLEQLKSLIEKATSDGLLSAEEMDSIKSFIRTDGKISPEEMELCQTLIWDKIESGELEYEWD